MGMGSVQKIHDGESEEMVKDMVVGRGGARWMGCLGEVRGGEEKELLLRHKLCATTSCCHLHCWSSYHLHTITQQLYEINQLKVVTISFTANKSIRISPFFHSVIKKHQNLDFSLTFNLVHSIIILSLI